jgi:lipopolysaccharide export system permease protein
VRLLDRQILLELAGPFVFGVAAFTSIFFAGNYLLKLTDYMLKGMSPVVAVELVGLYLPGVVVLTLPMSMLLAALYGFGRLSSDSEVVALFSSGVSLKRIAVPVAAMGLLVALLSLLLNEVIVPGANVLSKELQVNALNEPAQRKEAFTYVETSGNVITQVLVRGGISSRVVDRDGEQVRVGIMKDIGVVEYRDGKPVVFFKAREAVWEGGNQWVLHDGYSNSLGPGPGQGYVKFGSFKTEVIQVHRDPDDIALNQRRPEDMSIWQLSRLLKRLKPAGAETRELEVGLYNKLALPMAGMVFALIGLPLGVRPHRSGSSYGMGLSIIIILVYWLVWHYMTALAMQGGVSPMFGAFAANIAGFGAAALLLRRAAN